MDMFRLHHDDEAMTELRLRQANLIGPSASSRWRTARRPDSCSAGSARADELSVVEMGGSGTASEESV